MKRLQEPKLANLFQLKYGARNSNIYYSERKLNNFFFYLGK